MTELDKLISVLREDMDNNEYQSKFYDAFLNMTFFVPTVDKDSLPPEAPALEEGHVMPLVIDHEGKDYLMVFETKERMQAWAETEEVPHVEVPGYMLAATSEPPLHWALNVGTPYSKEFIPDEIAWLKDVVEKCNAEAQKNGQ